MLYDCFDLSLILKQDSESGSLLPWDGTKQQIQYTWEILFKIFLILNPALL